MDHVVGLGYGPVLVGDEREVQLHPLRRLDVAGPRFVIADAIDAQAEDLDAALVELGLQLGHGTELGRADRREVLGVAEEDGPVIADPLVEADLALGGRGGEIGGGVAQSDGHFEVAPELQGSGRTGRTADADGTASREGRGRGEAGDQAGGVHLQRPMAGMAPRSFLVAVMPAGLSRSRGSRSRGSRRRGWSRDSRLRSWSRPAWPRLPVRAGASRGSAART
jgi:hypothetical protein